MMHLCVCTVRVHVFWTKNRAWSFPFLLGFWIFHPFSLISPHACKEFFGNAFLHYLKKKKFPFFRPEKGTNKNVSDGHKEVHHASRTVSFQKIHNNKTYK